MPSSAAHSSAARFVECEKCEYFVKVIAKNKHSHSQVDGLCASLRKEQDILDYIANEGSTCKKCGARDVDVSHFIDRGNETRTYRVTSCWKKSNSKGSRGQAPAPDSAAASAPAAASGPNTYDESSDESNDEADDGCVLDLPPGQGYLVGGGARHREAGVQEQGHDHFELLSIHSNTSFSDDNLLDVPLTDDAAIFNDILRRWRSNLTDSRVDILSKRYLAITTTRTMHSIDMERIFYDEPPVSTSLAPITADVILLKINKLKKKLKETATVNDGYGRRISVTEAAALYERMSDLTSALHDKASKTVHDILDALLDGRGTASWAHVQVVLRWLDVVHALVRWSSGSFCVPDDLDPLVPAEVEACKNAFTKNKRWASHQLRNEYILGKRRKVAQNNIVDTESQERYWIMLDTLLSMIDYERVSRESTYPTLPDTVYMDMDSRMDSREYLVVLTIIEEWNDILDVMYSGLLWSSEPVHKVHLCMSHEDVAHQEHMFYSLALYSLPEDKESLWEWAMGE